MWADQESQLSQFVANPSPLFRRIFIKRKARESLAKLGDECEICRVMDWTALMSAVDQFGQHYGAEGNTGVGRSAAAGQSGPCPCPAGKQSRRWYQAGSSRQFVSHLQLSLLGPLEFALPGSRCSIDEREPLIDRML